MATTLRARAPFHCRRQIGDKLCLAVLTETDEKYCPPCQAILNAQLNPAAAALTLKPIIQAPRELDTIEPKPHWPFWP